MDGYLMLRLNTVVNKPRYFSLIVILKKILVLSYMIQYVQTWKHIAMRWF